MTFYDIDCLALICATIISTASMTVFSYIVAFITQKQLREPELLNIMIENLSWSKIAISKKSYIGWLIHFITGLLFSIAMVYFIDYYSLSWNAKNAIYMGSLAGIMGIIGWSIMVYLHPNPPKFDFKAHALQLFFAHIIFGVVFVLGYSLLAQ